MPIRVLIADDQPIFGRALEALMAGDEAIEVVGRAGDGREAVELAARLSPDVILMDITMPLVDGLEATRRIRDADPRARVLVLTGSSLPSDGVRARRAGAAGYVTKARIGSDLREAIVGAASG